MSIFEILTCILLVGIAAFFSAAEIAVFSLSRFQLRSLKERFRPTYRNVRRLLNDPSGLLLSVLVICEIINISLSALIAEAVSRDWDRFRADSGWGWMLSRLIPGAPAWAMQTLIGTLITWPIVLLFCEITPKVIAARASQLVATLSCGPLALVYDIFVPIRRALSGFLSAVSALLNAGRQSRSSATQGDQILREEEFLSMVEEGHKEGAIQESEMELIRNVFELDNTTVAEVMVPIEQVLALSAHTPVRSAISAVPARRFSRIPVFGANRKKIVGVLYSKDLLIARLENDPDVLGSSIESLLRKPMVTQPSTRLNGVFLRMKKQKMHMAIVENSVGEAVGVLTMSDVLEALFEDIIPEDEELT